MGKVLEFKKKGKEKVVTLPEPKEVDTAALEAALEGLKNSFSPEELKQMWDELDEIVLEESDEV